MFQHLFNSHSPFQPCRKCYVPLTFQFPSSPRPPSPDVPPAWHILPSLGKLLVFVLISLALTASLWPSQVPKTWAVLILGAPVLPHPHSWALSGASYEKSYGRFDTHTQTLNLGSQWKIYRCPLQKKKMYTYWIKSEKKHWLSCQAVKVCIHFFDTSCISLASCLAQSRGSGNVSFALLCSLGIGLEPPSPLLLKSHILYLLSDTQAVAARVANPSSGTETQTKPLQRQSRWSFLLIIMIL